MSIERMKKLWAVMEHDRLHEFLDYVAGLRVVHLVETAEPEADLAASGETGTVPTEGQSPFSRARAESPSTDARIAQLTHVLDTLGSFEPAKRTFGETFVGFPLEVTAEELARAVEMLNDSELSALDAEVTALFDETAALKHRIDEIHIERGHLAHWEQLHCTAPEAYPDVSAWLGTVTARNDALLRESDEAGELLVLNELGRGKDNRVLLQVAALKGDETKALDILHRLDFMSLPLPAGVSAHDMLGMLDAELAGAEARLVEIAAQAKDLANRRRHDVTAALGWYELRREVARSQEKPLLTPRLVVATGYVRARDEAMLADAVAAKFPDVGLRFEDPAPDENVPVELRTSAFVRPAQFLVSMFGLPHYRAFDPSPFIMLNFLLFFGFCFGDVIYGIGLIAMGLYIARRVKGYPGVHNFFTLLAWGGLSAMIVGALTGSWGGDLISETYLAAGNPLVRARNALCILDMVQKPVAALLVAIAIGVMNQFYGIIMKMYTEFRRGDWKAGLFDGGLWLVMLPGVILLLVPMFAPDAPGWVFRTGACLAGAGAVGLVLTQGRNEKSFFGKAVVGVVSLYGIFGSYGATSFIGDTLSYCRLLALGLTTSIVALCFNIIAAMTKDIPVAGIFTVTLILVIGHVFNFFISVLGAFVHSARLVFLEFFGRFYEIGGNRFSPLGASERVRVTDR